MLDAIAREDFDDLRGELGDLLFQVVFYAQIAQEEGGALTLMIFALLLGDKLGVDIRMFLLTVLAENSSEVLAVGTKSKPKSAQKAQHSALDDIPRSLPAKCVRKIQKRCANVGFDWTTLGPVVDKVTKRSTR